MVVEASLTQINRSGRAPAPPGGSVPAPGREAADGDAKAYGKPGLREAGADGDAVDVEANHIAGGATIDVETVRDFADVNAGEGRTD